MSETVTVRTARAHDVDAVVDIYGEALHPSYVSFSELGEGKAEAPEQLTGSAVRIFREQLVRILDSPEHGCFVATLEDGALAGFALASLHHAEAGHQECWIDDIAVRPRAQRRGIAQSLMERAFEWGQQRQARYFLLESGVNNTSAHHLFSQLGFRPLATVFWRDGNPKAPR